MNKNHAVTQVKLHHGRMITGMRLVHDIDPPRVKCVKHANKTKAENQLVLP